jgi:hypothetical protein
MAKRDIFERADLGARAREEGVFGETHLGKGIPGDDHGKIGAKRLSRNIWQRGHRNR